MSNYPGLQQIFVTMTSADVAYPLSATVKYTPMFSVQALATNTGYVFVGGGSTVSATFAAAVLDSGQAFSMETPQQDATQLMDLSKIFVRSTVAGEQVFVGYLEMS